jgi:hypothetical protein
MSNRTDQTKNTPSEFFFLLCGEYCLRWTGPREDVNIYEEARAQYFIFSVGELSSFEFPVLISKTISLQPTRANRRTQLPTTRAAPLEVSDERSEDGGTSEAKPVPSFLLHVL